VILAVGTRLQDFTTGSWTAFALDARSSASTWRAMTRQSTVAARGGRCEAGAESAGRGDGGYKAPADWTDSAQAERKMGRLCRRQCGHKPTGNRPNSYAQAIGVVNALCDPRDRVVTAAGGLPAEVTANWRTLDIGTVDVEFGFSCMGYEIAGGWGARIAQSENEPDSRTPSSSSATAPICLMNSDIYSSVLTRKKLIVLVLDNGGFAVINKLQNNTGNESFNNLIADCPTVPEPFAVDFEAHAALHGRDCRTRGQPRRTGEAFKRAKAATRPPASSS
jgi:3D-(3,5/4)-trihydroxycyclohexane-1,2-dione acylhydrolase (decyclizing)